VLNFDYLSEAGTLVKAHDARAQRSYRKSLCPVAAGGAHHRHRHRRRFSPTFPPCPEPFSLSGTGLEMTEAYSQASMVDSTCGITPPARATIVTCCASALPMLPGTCSVCLLFFCGRLARPTLASC
jgi:hypothetical protein